MTLSPDKIPPETAIFTRDALESVLDDRTYTPAGLVCFLSIRYGAELDADAGVREGYSVRQHTVMGLSQFAKHENDTPLPLPMTRGLFRVMYGFHDIGKKEAIQNGNKRLQHRYTRPIMQQALGALDYTDPEQRLAVATAGHDFVGNTLRRSSQGDARGIHDNALSLVQTAEKADVSAVDLLKLMILLYKVDVSSYTEDAGGNYVYDPARGNPSMAFLFDFETGEAGLHFAPAAQHIVQQLGERTSALAGAS